MKAINFEAMVAANRERILNLPEAPANTVTWNPERLAFDVNTKGVTTFGTTPNGNN